MSGAESESKEWKTIRISMPIYSKLVQLSGLFTLVTGIRTTPMSTVADMAIDNFYEELYPKLKTAMLDSEVFQSTIRKLGPDLKRIYDSRDQWKLLLEQLEKNRR